MTGLEKMKSRILEEARSSAEAKIQDAERQAEELLAAQKSQAEKSAAAVLTKARAEAESLKEKVWWVKMPLGTIPEDITFYVKNKKVKRQLRDMYGFQGKIIIKKKMKRYDKLK